MLRWFASMLIVAFLSCLAGYISANLDRQAAQAEAVNTLIQEGWTLTDPENRQAEQFTDGPFPTYFTAR